MSNLGFIRRIVLVGAVAVSVSGLSAALQGAEAMPAAPLSGASAAGLSTVQYYGEGYRYRRPYRRPAYGYGYGYRYRGRAGLYRCGVYAHHTHLERKACR